MLVEPHRTKSVETSRIRLVPYSPADYLALLEGEAQFEQQFGVRAAAGLRDFFASDEVSPAFLERLRAAGGADPWVHGFAAVHRADNLVIGSAGFKGPPDEAGMVEIAYGIVPGYQQQGYATEAAAALVDLASRDARVQLIRAHTLPENEASARVLVKCGFQHVGEVDDPDDGRVWRWERSPGRS